VCQLRRTREIGDGELAGIEGRLLIERTRGNYDFPNLATIESVAEGGGSEEAWVVDQLRHCRVRAR
jgi:hypothetical protein